MRRSSRSVRTRSTCPSSRKAVDGATVGRRLVSWNVSPSVQTGAISMSGEAASRVYTPSRLTCTLPSRLRVHPLALYPYTPYARRCTPAEKRRCTSASRLHLASRQRLQRPVPLRFFRSCSHALQAYLVLCFGSVKNGDCVAVRHPHHAASQRFVRPCRNARNTGQDSYQFLFQNGTF